MTSGANVIEIVEELGSIANHLVGVDGPQGRYRLSLQTYIIIIGGVDDGIFRLSIEQPALVGWRQQRALFIDTAEGTIGQSTKLMELTIARTALTETHLLDIGNQQLKLVVGSSSHL